jgi:diguanylate cyclase (GGDEF)-like protein
VADDCADAASVLVEGLQLHNYEAFAVYSGEDALLACEKGGIDLLLLDVGMPGIDGYEVCRRLKANPKTSDIAIIFVTAAGARCDVSQGFALGAVDYIVKPYNLPMVMLRLDSVMRTRQVLMQNREDDECFFDSAYTDQLTGLRNRRFLLERLQEEVDKAHRYGHPVSCVIFDIDEVRAVDDELGAAPLDDLLAEVAFTLRSYSRTYDVLARYDGSVFCAILPYAPIEDAIAYAEKIIGEISSMTFSDPCFPTHASMSIGAVSCRNGSAKGGADSVLGEAMRGLLEAKSRFEKRLVARDMDKREN